MSTLHGHPYLRNVKSQISYLPKKSTFRNRFGNRFAAVWTPGRVILAPSFIFLFFDSGCLADRIGVIVHWAQIAFLYVYISITNLYKMDYSLFKMVLNIRLAVDSGQCTDSKNFKSGKILKTCII